MPDLADTGIGGVEFAISYLFVDDTHHVHPGRLIATLYDTIK